METLVELIAKKRDIKTAAMQQLLSFVGAGIYATSCPVVYEWRVNRYGRWYQVPVSTCY